MKSSCPAPWILDRNAQTLRGRLPRILHVSNHRVKRSNLWVLPIVHAVVGEHRARIVDRVGRRRCCCRGISLISTDHVLVAHRLGALVAELGRNHRAPNVGVALAIALEGGKQLAHLIANGEPVVDHRIQLLGCKLGVLDLLLERRNLAIARGDLGVLGLDGGGVLLFFFFFLFFLALLKLLFEKLVLILQLLNACAARWPHPCRSSGRATRQ